MRKQVLLILGILALSLLVAGLAAAQGGYDLFWRTVDGGGGGASGGALNLSGTVGQADAGGLAGGAFTMTGGFWGGVAAGSLEFADTLYLPAVLKSP